MTMTRSRQVLPGILTLTPTSLDTWNTCRRRYLNQHVLGIPESDPTSGSSLGLFVHHILQNIHDSGSCQDDEHVHRVLASEQAHSDHMFDMIDRHRRRCPTTFEVARHEVWLARSHRSDTRFVVVARIDALWVHDGLLDARDYKTGRQWHTTIADDPAARAQAWVLDRWANRRDLRLRLRYEYLATEIDDDPLAYEPESEDLATVETELRTVVEAMRHEDQWTVVNDPSVCTNCHYRSICPDSAAPPRDAAPNVTE